MMQISTFDFHLFTSLKNTLHDNFYSNKFEDDSVSGSRQLCSAVAVYLLLCLEGAETDCNITTILIKYIYQLTVSFWGHLIQNYVDSVNIIE